MNKDLPTENSSVFWIYADNSKYIFQRPQEERVPGKWLLFEGKTHINETWSKIKLATEKGLLETDKLLSKTLHSKFKIKHEHKFQTPKCRHYNIHGHVPSRQGSWSNKSISRFPKF